MTLSHTKQSSNSILELGLAVAHIPRAKRVAEGDALAGVLGRATPCGPYGARPSASGNLTTSSQAHLPMGRDHPQGYTPNEVSREAGSSGLRLLDSGLQLKYVDIFFKLHFNIMHNFFC